MPQLSKIVGDYPASLKARIRRNLPDVARALDATAAEVLGKQGSPSARSRPGEPPRRQSGQLQILTHAVIDPADLSIALVTSKVGQFLNRGTRRIRARPFANLILRKSAAARHAAMYRR